MSDRAIAIVVERLGPYHVAQLSALAELMGGENVVAIEVCARDDVYAWDLLDSHASWRRHTLFSSASSARDVRALWKRLAAVLSSTAFGAVLVPGWSKPSALGALDYCRREAVRSVMMSDSSELDRSRSWLREEVKRRVVSMADAMLVAGARHASYAEQLGMPRARIRTGYDVVDNAHFAEGAERARVRAAALRRELDLPERYLLASGRFVEKKNWFGLLRAYQSYRRLAGSAASDLVVLGDGELRVPMERLVTELGLEERVHLVGFRQYDELPFYYGLASGFVHASIVDQWGLVVNEAMAAGLPVLVSDRCGCAPDLVEEGVNGWTFDPRNEEALSAAMLRLTKLGEDERRLMGRESGKRIERWSPNVFAANAVEAVEVACREPTRRPKRRDEALLWALARRRAA